MEKHQDSSFTVSPAQSRRDEAKKISDAQFADDIVMVTNAAREAEELMQDMDTMSMSVGLNMNEIKTKYLLENIKKPEKIMNVGGKPPELVEDFLYLGAKIGNTVGDIVERKSKAWVACRSLRSIWKSDLPTDAMATHMSTDDVKLMDGLNLLRKQRDSSPNRLPYNLRRPNLAQKTIDQPGINTENTNIRPRLAQ
ncbi:uncharacterized protein LOC106882658 [Octopus bimaculoides]|uniref:uncharacterized protein LOC106882658 n=1 Tax=Octopus bimaculoides TaxID=37653 RepID=UPI00071D71BD|nr:uncharacterized protein LOC106882658 [Octopus bimaculoides]|eukprot:XP_014788902.1 PREDICTED: uncharacterized protein LOC106882658 [Octopus bimaculoides]